MKREHWGIVQLAAASLSLGLWARNGWAGLALWCLGAFAYQVWGDR
jgi:hypothetical protein